MLWNIQYKKMETYCISCKKNTANNSSARITKPNRLFLSNCAICSKKKSRFIKNQKVSGLEPH